MVDSPIQQKKVLYIKVLPNCNEKMQPLLRNRLITMPICWPYQNKAMRTLD